MTSFLMMQDQYSIQTKAGNINTQNINDYFQNITLFKVCPEKETAWITEQWKTSLAD